ncbi:hypothetical protein H920_15164 [Fukomys damarensis]|uniref:Uncharacterized protein n=1 Tax=Fukomys damarensis TaxID=885580 RepID=A0A091CUZ6_FUKDA|nr:hypothetical protein H920_15164 [Fukomys damarensis]
MAVDPEPLPSRRYRLKSPLTGGARPTIPVDILGMRTALGIPASAASVLCCPCELDTTGTVFLKVSKAKPSLLLSLHCDSEARVRQPDSSTLAFAPKQQVLGLQVHADGVVPVNAVN